MVSQPEREQRVSVAFVALADTLVDDYDIIDLLDQLVAHSVTLLAADAAGILLADPREQLRPIAASSEDAETMELLQLQSDEGPCLEAYRTAAQVRIPDLSQAAQRWPRFVAAVTRAGAFASVHAIPLRLRGQAIGALNLFHREPGGMSTPISPSVRRWPMWPPSASCRNARSAAVRCSTNNCRPPCTVGWSSSKPRVWWPNTSGWR